MKKVSFIYNDLLSLKDISSIIKIDNDSLQIALFNDTSVDELEKQLFHLSKISVNHTIIYFIFTFFAVFGLLFLLGAINVFESLFYRIFIERSFDFSYIDIASLFFTLIVAMTLFFLPSFAQGESNALSQSLKSWFFKDIRRQKRIKKAFNKLNIKKVEIYNIDIFEETTEFYTIFLKSAVEICDEIQLHIRKRNRQKLHQYIQTIGEYSFSARDNILSEPNLKNLSKIFDQTEQKLFEIVVQSAFNAKQKPVVAFELYHILVTNLLKESKVDSNTFLNECFDEFYLLKDRFIGTATLVNFDYNVSEDMQKGVEFFIRSNVEQLVKSIDEPVSLLCIYEKSKTYGMRFHRQVFLLKSLINAAYISKNYNILSFGFFDIIGEIEGLSEEYLDSIYKQLDAITLENLFEILKKSGEFYKALMLCDYLKVLNPFRYDTMSAVLLERMGKFDEAFEIMQSLEPKNGILSDQIYYHERFAWLIVSARFTEKTTVGLEHLDIFERLVLQQNPKNPTTLWNLYNIKANYHEWMGELDKAIEAYKIALCIPTIGNFEYGASLLNYSVALRLKFIQHKDPEDIKKAVELAQNSINFKLKIGDKDETPLIYHNLALHYFYGIKFGVFEIGYAKYMLKNGQNAYEIAIQNSSSKRVAIMLAEIIIAKDMLNLDNSSEISELKHIQILHDERKNIDELFALHFQAKVLI